MADSSTKPRRVVRIKSATWGGEEVERPAEDIATYPREIQNLGEIQKELLRGLIVATGRERADKDWFNNSGDLLPGKKAIVQTVPTLHQLGLKKRVSKSSLELDNQKRSRNPSASYRESRAYAVLNDPYNHYTGPYSSNMSVIAAGAATTMVLTAEVLVPVFSVLLQYGHRGLGFPTSSYSIEKCIKEGMPILVGLGGREAYSSVSGAAMTALSVAAGSVGPSGLNNRLGGASPPLAESPGFYAVLVRQALLDIETLERSEIINSPGWSILNPGNIRDLLERMRDLTIVKMLAAAAHLGDISLKRRAAEATQAHDGSAPSAGSGSDYIKNQHDIPGRTEGYKFRGLTARQRGARTFLGDTGRLATSLRDLPSLFLPPVTRADPNRFITVAEKFQPKFGLGNGGDESKRILESIKRELEKEALPFWIQDMRTGEVAAFHAFLETFQDNYSPQVGAMPTMGRMDDVLSFNRTTRSVNLSFHMFATHPDEHDALWWTINWLTMLIYPQWSEGIEVNDQGKTSPFGRVPSASPLVRIRLGDFLKSNAGTESLANLLRSERERRSDHDSAPYGDLRGAALKGLDGESDLRAGTIWRVPANPQGYPIDETEGSKRWLPTWSRAFNTSKESDEASIPTYDEALFIVTSVPEEGNEVVGALFLNNQNLGKVRVPKNLLHPNHGASGDADVDAQQARRTAVASEDTSNASHPFIQSLTRNSLDGLAGMIESFSLDYSWIENNKFALELNRGSVAPIGVLVNLTLKVIHDIQPGLDSLGRNRAPIYPVGAPSTALVGDWKVSSNSEEEGE